MEQGIKEDSPLGRLMKNLPQIGYVEWIGIREVKRGEVIQKSCVELSPDQGILGDHYAGRSGNRQVTLISGEHLDAIASMLGQEILSPALLRRNLVIRGINLLALKGLSFSLGEAQLEMTGLCHPCSRMEENLGAGGYNAVRGHGGITARVIQGGKVCLDDRLQALV